MTGQLLFEWVCATPAVGELPSGQPSLRVSLSRPEVMPFPGVSAGSIRPGAPLEGIPVAELHGGWAEAFVETEGSLPHPPSARLLPSPGVQVLRGSLITLLHTSLHVRVGSPRGGLWRQTLR